jgi:hypothetical protein
MNRKVKQCSIPGEQVVWQHRLQKAPKQLQAAANTALANHHQTK